MVLAHPYITTDADLQERERLQVVVVNRETGERYENDVFKMTVVENPLKLVTQFVTSASSDKYRIYLRDRIVVAHANTFDSILADWVILEKNVHLDQITNPNKVQAICDIVDQLRKEQKRHRKEIQEELEVRRMRAQTTAGSSHKSDRDNASDLDDFEDASLTQEEIQSLNAAETPHGGSIATGTVGVNASPSSFTSSGRVESSREVQSNSDKKVVVEIFQNQRSGLIGDFSEGLLFAIDKCGPWSTRDLVPITKDDFTLPDGNWKWTDEWHVDTQGGDAQGWMYAVNWNSTWFDSPGKTTFVRRRRWVRTRVYEEPQPVQQNNTVTQVTEEFSFTTEWRDFTARYFVTPLKSITASIGLEVGSRSGKVQSANNAARENNNAQNTDADARFRSGSVVSMANSVGPNGVSSGNKENLNLVDLAMSSAVLIVSVCLLLIMYFSLGLSDRLHQQLLDFEEKYAELLSE